jgi:hypothetical protein
MYVSAFFSALPDCLISEIINEIDGWCAKELSGVVLLTPPYRCRMVLPEREYYL